ncbi:DUF724 domain-containing protein 7-like [Papaver somniferum]|uniref:DUF724 domain-containing protein 7-like n=1 Tax=Papaver somniferum TaxID=3469 RepID=UPI000E6FCAB6|nr:DUF724 domain-containing protein 7-like [Papaver somniferum]
MEEDISSSGCESINSTSQTRKRRAESEMKCSECNTVVTHICGRTQSKCIACYFRDRSSTAKTTTTSTPPAHRRKASTPVSKWKRILCASNHSSSSSVHHHQQTPPPPLSSPSMASIRLSPGDNHCLQVPNDFITSQEKLFQIMPQNPHLKPLEKDPPSARKGMKLMFDLDFTNLAEKLQESVDPLEFYAKAGEYTWQMTTLEEMGYNVVKLKQKFDVLSKISVIGKANRDEIEETREKIRVLEAEASANQKRIQDLETEVQQLKDELKSEDEEIEAMKLLERELAEEKANKWSAFMSVAAAPWI